MISTIFLLIGKNNEITTVDNNETYGPFSALYGPKYNNWDIYNEMFGEYSITELKENPNRSSTSYTIKGKTSSIYGDLQQAPNLPQKLLEKLIGGGNVIIFGYGLSGSGKTWTTV